MAAVTVADKQSDGRKANGASPGGKPDGATSSAKVKATGRREQATAGPDGPDARVVGDTFKTTGG